MKKKNSKSNLKYQKDDKEDEVDSLANYIESMILGDDPTITTLVSPSLRIQSPRKESANTKRHPVIDWLKQSSPTEIRDFDTICFLNGHSTDLHCLLDILNFGTNKVVDTKTEAMKIVSVYLIPNLKISGLQEDSDILLNIKRKITSNTNTPLDIFTRLEIWLAENLKKNLALHLKSTKSSF